MNCCDDYGDCNQGRDCPVRVARVGRKDYAREPLPPTVWRRHVGALAKWMGLGLLGWLVWAPLIYLLLRA
jgi:hypothetical protein